MVSSGGTTGSASAVFTIVNNPTVTVTPPADQNITVGANGTPLNATETPGASGNTRVWQVSTTSNTTGFSNITGQTAISYTPNFSMAGTYFVRVQSTFAACAAVNSNAVQITVTAVPTPTLTVTPAVLTGFTTTVGTPSPEQSFLLTGSNLTGSVTVTPPTGYALALTSGGTYRTAPTTVTQANATAGQTIFVRLTGATVGTYGTPAAPVFVVSTATGATAQNVAVDGEVTPLTPAIVATPGSLSGFTATVGTASAAQSYTLTPTALSAPITVMAPTGFEVSLTAGSGYGNTVTASATATTTIYVRLAATAALGVYNSVVTNVSGTVSQDVAVSGSVSPAPVAGGPGLLVLEEDFDYPVGTRLYDLPYWNGLTGGNTNPVTVSGTSLSFDQYGSPARIGASVTIKGGQDVGRGFTVAAGTTDYYASVLANVTNAPSTADYFFALMPTAASSNFAARVYTKSSGSGVQFGISFSTSTAVYGSTVYALGTPVALVARYIINPGASDDVLELYAFAVSDGIPLAKPSTPLATVNGFNGTTEYIPGAVAIRQGNGTQSITLDGIRVGTGWGAVVGRPVYTAASSIINPGYYYDVTVNNGDALTLSGAVSIEKQLTLTSGTVNTTATNLLTLAATADVTARAANTFGPLSFVNGPLARQTPAVGSTATDFIFPVGQASVYRPLTLSVTNQAATTYTAKQLEGAPAASTLPTGVTRASSIRSYTLTPNVQPVTATPTFQAALTIPFGPDDFVNDPATLVMVKRSGAGAAWENIGNSATTGISTVGKGDNKRSVAGTLTSAPFATFSEFTLATTSTDPTINPLSANAGTPLPVELAAFTARRQAPGVALSWTTASEKNSAYFEVQRSLSGGEFATVARVSAQGSTSQRTAYTSLDEKAPASTLYYRLRQVDADGTAAYSPVLTVAGTRAELTLYPNPAHTSLTILAEAATPYRVLNHLGQVLLQGTTQAGQPVNVQPLAPGVYHVEVQTSAGRVVRKFIKD